jgi:conjugative transposon TraM protein
MKKKTELDGASKKRRTFLLVVPLLVLPFVTLAFYAFGGGQDSDDTVVVKETGLQTTLPESQNAETDEDKMSFYARADRDSMQLAEMKRLDPYYQNGLDTISGKGLAEENYTDANEAKVMQRLHALQQAVNAPVDHKIEKTFLQKGYEPQQFDKLMLPAKEIVHEDPEMQQLNEMLEKIQAIQNPESIREKLRNASEKQKAAVYPVITRGVIGDQYLGPDTIPNKINGFYGFAEEDSRASNFQSAIAAIIHEAQMLTDGATVKMRLLTDVFIRGQLIPKNAFAFGTAALQNDRLVIKIANIQNRNDLFPVSLSVYDQDGIEGIFIPGSINREVSKNSADQSLQGLNLISMDPSLKAQAAAAGVTAAKGLLSKKVKQIKVFVKANYRILLKDNNQQNF